MRFYLEMMYEVVPKRTLSLKKVKVPELIALYITCNDKALELWAHKNTRHDMARKIEAFILKNNDNSPVSIYGANLGCEWKLFNDLWETNRPPYLPERILDIEAWADACIFPGMNMEQVVIDGDIDFVPTRQLTISEKREVIAFHKEHPSGKENHRGDSNLQRLHEFYIMLQKNSEVYENDSSK